MHNKLFPKEIIPSICLSKHRQYMIYRIIGIFLLLINLKVIFPLSGSGSIVLNESTFSNPDSLSIILMIGDGMGFEHVKLAQWVEKGVNGNLSMQELPIKGKVTTHNIVNSITDSAASATAMATGYKTYNGVLSRSLAGVELSTILELAQQLQKSTGIITTTEVTHATPAAFYSHVQNRGYEFEIAQQLVTSEIDIVMGGGRNKFIPYLNTLQTQGYTIVENRTELLSVTEGKFFGLFTESAFPYEQDRDRETVPSLAEMTEKTIDILSQDTDGFFLIVEGGQIDWASHVTNKVNAALETIEFDKAVKTALDFVKTHDAILVVTADHETGGLMVSSETLVSSLPEENNPEEVNESLRINRTREISLSWASGGHTNAKVPIFAYGNSLNAITNTTIDNIQIYSLIKNFILPFDQGNPVLKIFAPENKSYDKSTIMLSLSTNESLPWIAYSLDHESNITIPSLSKLISFTDGTHFLKVYANDTMGNPASAEVYFTVNATIKTETTTTVTPTSTQTTTTTSSYSETSTPAIGFEILFSMLLFLILSLRKKRTT